jgi:hypothetical protein
VGTKCSGVCVDTQTDKANCGACGHVCQNADVCSQGQCVANCSSAQCGAQNCMGFTSTGCGAPPCSGTVCGTACGSVCVTLSDDPANCGACGHACTQSEYCNNGTCAPSCPSGLTCNSAGVCTPPCP